VVIDQARDGQVIASWTATVRRFSSRGAIYLHGGESYLVRRLDWKGRRAEVETVEAGYYTQASTSSPCKSPTHTNRPNPPQHSRPRLGADHLPGDLL